MQCHHRNLLRVTEPPRLRDLDEFVTRTSTQVLRRHLIFQVLTKPISNLGGVFMSVNGDRVLQ
jgi:hypothetical protein